jgi:hypothetical protein
VSARHHENSRTKEDAEGTLGGDGSVSLLLSSQHPIKVQLSKLQKQEDAS